MRETLKKPEGTIKNGHSREIGNIGCTRHRTRINKTKRKRQTRQFSSGLEYWICPQYKNNCIKTTTKNNMDRQE